MANERLERFSKIRALLDFPYAQKPSPHQLLNQMLTDEQDLNIRLTNSRQPWNLVTATLNVESGTDTYEIEQPISDYQSSGKVYFVVRTTDNADLPYLPIAFDDFSDMDYGKMPSSPNSGLITPEKISFYRTSIQGQTIQAVLSPTPQNDLTYTIWFFAGALDRARALMSGTGPIVELSDYLDRKTAAAALPYAEWRDDDAFNAAKRQTLAAGLMSQLVMAEMNVEKYIKNINHPKGFEMDYWDE